jgi:hypothetical protein
MAAERHGGRATWRRQPCRYRFGKPLEHRIWLGLAHITTPQQHRHSLADGPPAYPRDWELQTESWHGSFIATPETHAIAAAHPSPISSCTVAGGAAMMTGVRDTGFGCWRLLVQRLTSLSHPIQVHRHPWGCMYGTARYTSRSQAVGSHVAPTVRPTA